LAAPDTGRKQRRSPEASRSLDHHAHDPEAPRRQQRRGASGFLANANTGRERTQRRHRSMSRLSVLYVEDDDSHVIALKHAFRVAGLEAPLFTAPDGEVAVEFLSGVGDYADRSHYPLPSLVLLDINMPCLCGLEVLHWIRTASACRDLPVVMLSSSTHYDDVAAAYQMGANGYLVKSGGIERLVRFAVAIKSLLSSTEPLRGWLPFDGNHPIPENAALPPFGARSEGDVG
jgi:CheY-like chemotaxis protein